MRKELEPMEQAFLLLKNQNERWDEIIREYNERKFDELLAGFHQRNTPNKSLRLTSAQNSSKYHPSKNLHLARKLANPENTSFRDENLRLNRGEELPLETQLTREPLGGRFVYPSHARAFMATQGRPTIDVPSSKRNAALNLYGFEGTPERYGKNQDPEGIIYGDLEEDSVHRLNKNPFILRDLQRAAGMFQPSYNAPSKVGIDGAERHRARELARMIMDAEIPGALIDPETARAHGIESFEDMTPKNKIGDITQIVNDLTGNIPMPTDRANAPLHGTFQQWERSMGPSGRVAELDETHTSPEQMQLLDDQLTAIPGAYSQSGQYYKSKPMDIAMRLLKMPLIPPGQTTLGEHHDDFPSPYGPVVGYHGTTGDNFMDIMGGAGIQNPDPNYRTITTNPSEAATYGMQRSGDARNTPSYQSQPKLVGIRQAAFDQNHPNYIGPSHGLKNSDDYQGAQHYGGNIPRQFLTNVPMSNETLQDTMQAREGHQDIIDRNMSYPAESQNRVIRRTQQMQNEPPMQSPIVNQRGEVRPQEPTQFQMNRAKWSKRGRTGEQMMADYNQQMAQYMQPNPVVQPTDPNQQQLPLQQPQVQQPQMIQASEPMEIAMQLLKERVSPEAKRHKLEYDKKYESSPERVKYREDLNRERRRRHIMGQGGPDMSHTSQHTIVPEDPHTNRARHFKDKGTLL